MQIYFVLYFNLSIIVSNELLYKKIMSRTYKTSPKFKSQKKHRCTCERCGFGRRYNYLKKMTIKDGALSEGEQWCIDRFKDKRNL